MTRLVQGMAVALLALLAPLPVVAVGLGGIEVESRLNEPFRARIALAGLRAGEVDDLRAVLAGDDAFARAGVTRSHMLTRFKFTPKASGSGRAHLLVTSRDALREPAFSFVVELTSSGQVLRRRYDVMLNLR